MIGLYLLHPNPFQFIIHCPFTIVVLTGFHQNSSSHDETGFCHLEIATEPTATWTDCFWLSLLSVGLFPHYSMVNNDPYKTVVISVKLNVCEFRDQRWVHMIPWTTNKIDTQQPSMSLAFFCSPSNSCRRNYKWYIFRRMQWNSWHWGFIVFVLVVVVVVVVVAVVIV